MNPNPERKIATHEDRQLFWTNIMLSEDQDIKVRIKASELLAKSEGDFRAKKTPAKNPEWDFTLSDIIDDEIAGRGFFAEGENDSTPIPDNEETLQEAPPVATSCTASSPSKDNTPHLDTDIPTPKYESTAPKDYTREGVALIIKNAESGNTSYIPSRRDTLF